MVLANGQLRFHVVVFADFGPREQAQEKGVHGQFREPDGEAAR